MGSLSMSRPGKGNALLAVIVAGVALDTTTYAMVVPLLPDLARAMGFGQLAAGVLLAGYAVGLCVATPVAGIAVARRGAPAPLALGLAGLAGSLALFVLADDFLTLLMARTLQGAASAALWTAGLALIAAHWQEPARGRAMGLVMAGFAGGLLVGPPLGGGIADTLGMAAVFLLPAGLAALLLMAATRPLYHWPRQTAAPPGASLTLFRDRGILGAAAVVAVTAGLLGLLEPTLPLAMEARFGSGATVIGLMFGLLALMFAAAAPLAGEWTGRYGALSTIRLGAWPLVAVLPLFALAPGEAWIAPLFAATGALLALMVSPTLPAMAARVDRLDGASYGMAFAVFNLAFALGLLAGPLLGAALTAWLGLAAALVVAASTLAAAAAALAGLRGLHGFTK